MEAAERAVYWGGEGLKRLAFSPVELAWRGGVALLKHTADGVAAVANVVAILRTDTRIIDAEVEHIGTTAPRSRPEVAVVPLIARGAIGEDAGERRTQGSLEVLVVTAICRI